MTKRLKIAVCAIAKNENAYLREWVEHYLDMGIDHIFLYDNNDIDGEIFNDVIDDYIKSNFVEVIDKRGTEKGLVYNDQDINLQSECYNDCYIDRCGDYDWIGFFDIDEFFTIKNKLSLAEYLTQAKFDAYDTVIFPWEVRITSAIRGGAE